MVLSCSVAACSGLKNGGTGFGGSGGNGGGGGGGGGGTTGSVAVTLVANALPANPAILSLRVSVSALSLTSSGSPQTISLTTPVIVDLMRLQTDTVFLGTFGNIPAGSYAGVTLGLDATVRITLFNDTGATITGFTPACTANTICQATVIASGSPTASLPLTVTAGAVAGAGLNVNLSDVVSITGGALTVGFSNASLLTAFTLPQTGSNLATGSLELIEDFSGVATVSGNSLTVVSPTRGTLTATAATGTVFDASPDLSNPLCSGATSLSACITANGQIVSMDAVLKSDGTLAIQEVEPLLAMTEDVVEGTVAGAPASGTQFQMVVTDKPAAAQSSLTGTINVGDVLTVNLSNTMNPFLVDTKGLNFRGTVPIGNFAGATDTTPLRAGQTVVIHVTAFNGGTTPASVTVDTVMLRWSRFTAAVSTASQTLVNITSLPSNFRATGIFVVQVNTGTQGAQGVTNLDGVTDASQLSAQKPVAIRGLFIENQTNTANPAFFAAKVRQH